MFSTTDSIVAIATPPGRGGIGVVRLSGPEALAIARALITHRGEIEPRHATLTTIRLKPDPTTQPDPTSAQLVASDSPVASGFSRTSDAIDHAVVTFFPAPHSYTGDDVVEVSAHGSPVVLRAIVEAALRAGARHSEPGEFTLRAFLNGRMDLMQAEAIADLIDAVTPLQARTAFDQLDGTLTRVIAELDAELFDLVARLEASVDFPDEGFHFVEPSVVAASLDRLTARTASMLKDAQRGRLIREGFTVAIVGAPNVGKSSLFNALAGAPRAIVSDVPGTTRDLVTETIDLDGFRVSLVDTAGLRESADRVEAEGVQRAMGAQAVADVVLEVFDRSVPAVEYTPQVIDNKRLNVFNKADLPAACDDSRGVTVSARTGQGMDALRARIVAALDGDMLRDRPAMTNVRHIALVERAHAALLGARASLEGSGPALSEEFLLADLQAARTALEEVSGRRAPEDLLEHIFTRFCVGK